jgi:hypothetical protein
MRGLNSMGASSCVIAITFAALADAMSGSSENRIIIK